MKYYRVLLDGEVETLNVRLERAQAYVRSYIVESGDAWKKLDDREWTDGTHILKIVIADS